MAAASPPPPPNNHHSLQSSHSIDTNYAQTDDIDSGISIDDPALSSTRDGTGTGKGKRRGPRRVHTVDSCTPISRWRREPLRDVTNNLTSLVGRSPPRLRRVNTITELPGSDNDTPSRETAPLDRRPVPNSNPMNEQEPRRRLRRSHTTPSPYPSPYPTSAVGPSTDSTRDLRRPFGNGLASSPTTRQGTVLSSGGSSASAIGRRREERELEGGREVPMEESPNSRTIRMNRRRNLPITPPSHSARSRPSHEVLQEDSRQSSPSPPNATDSRIRRTRSSFPASRSREERDVMDVVGEIEGGSHAEGSGEREESGRALRRRRTSGGFR